MGISGHQNYTLLRLYHLLRLQHVAVDTISSTEELKLSAAVLNEVEDKQK